MKQEWVAAKDLVGLHGLPATIQGIHQKAKRGGWRKEKRITPGVKGHQVYFYLPDLPEKIRCSLVSKDGETPVRNDLNKGLISILEMTSAEDQFNLFRALCEFGIKGVLEHLQQPTRQATQADSDLDEQETAIRSLNIRESLKDAICMALAGNEETDKEILRRIESRARAGSPGGQTVATPEQETKPVSKKLT